MSGRPPEWQEEAEARAAGASFFTRRPGAIVAGAGSPALGIVGSALWQHLFDPGVTGLRNAMLSGLSFGLEALKNDATLTGFLAGIILGISADAPWRT